jgi:hypothetical protein
MTQSSDLQSLEARLTALENQLKDLKTSGMSSSATENPLTPGSSSAPGQWLAGALARSFFAQADLENGPSKIAAAGGSDSTFWCQSRFICATMQCGGSSWC